MRNPVHHDRTKHVKLDRHFITENVTSGTMQMEYVPSRWQTGDVFTKALPKDLFDNFVFKLGLLNIYTGKLEGGCRKNNPD